MMIVNLILFKKSGSQKSFPLQSKVTVIGRRQNCDLYIPLLSVSRRHCQLSQNKSSLEIRDLGSRNGTYLNGKRINEATAKPGDYITIGPLTFLLQIDGQPEKILPPKQPAKTTPEKETQKKKEPAAVEESESFADLDEEDSFIDLEEPDNLEEMDKSDAFMDGLEDL